MRKPQIPATIVRLLLFTLLVAAVAPSQQPVENRVNTILSQMTLEEKIDYIGGYHTFYVRAIPRLNVPELKMADGPLGVRNYGPSTAYPAGIAIAATWDTELANRVGTMIGRDARSRGVHFMLGPGLNIYRAPMCGRNFEYFGEDPFLAARMAVAEIKGMQSQGVGATAKHFAANNQEWDRHSVSSDMDERTLREIYLPAFEAAVKEGHVAALMNSYNLLNGTHATQNDHLNNQITKGEWKFDGIIMSDWDATYDGVAAAKGGLDLEMPSARFMNRETLLAAVKDGRVPVSVIDDKVRRILRQAALFGWLDREQTDKSIAADNPDSSKAALDAALGAIVLLKNERGILPLNKSKLKTVAVIGPNAAAGMTGGGGSSRVHPIHTTTFLQGIQQYLGSSVKVVHAAGIPSAADKFVETEFVTMVNGGEPGLKAQYFNNMALEGSPALVRTDKHVNYQLDGVGYAPGAPAYEYSARWTGYYIPKTSGEYRFYVSGDDGYRLLVDDKMVMNEWREQGDTLTERTLPLQAGRPIKVTLEYYQAQGGAAIRFAIAGDKDDPKPQMFEQAREAASKADAVILCLGFDAQSESEGSDRTYALPPEQQELLHAIVVANPNTILALTAGGSVATEGWIDKIPVLLHTWYLGQEGGAALAKVVFGEVSPSGRLPISWERRWEDSPVYDSYYDPNIASRQGGDQRSDGTARGHVQYKEGVFLGYRHFDRSPTKPLFAFGYGMSYTSFQYRNPKLSARKLRGDTPVTVSFEIKNTGKVSGGEVAQVYVAPGPAKVARPVKELKGFTKVFLKPGEAKRVSVQLDRRAFSYFDEAKQAWTLEPGVYSIVVGSSSQLIRFTDRVEWLD